MRVLVVGNGGREHALAWKLAQSPKIKQVYCAPGNGGTLEVAQNVPIPVDDFAALAQFVKDEGIDLTVVGPEAPLLAGIVDFFTQRSLPIFGPSAKAAKIEGSKSFAKRLMQRYQIPTAAYESFIDYQSALAYVREQGAPIVIKADGLAAGKGVIVAHTLAEAEQALFQMMQAGEFGQAGSRVVVEEYMEGEELTLLSFVDGQTVLPMVTVQDHKAVFDGDKGPNTGGMGTYAPVPHVSEELVQRIVETIVRPAANGMVQEGIPFRGVLYTGLMLTAEGPKVVEFNARFGDPEAQVVLPLLETDLLEVLLATVKGELASVELKWKQESAVCVIMASPGYPGSYERGAVISGLEKTDANCVVFHAGTKRTEQGLVTDGGRVLGVTGLGSNLLAAREAAYSGVRDIHFAGAHYRTDIGEKALRRQR